MRKKRCLKLADQQSTNTSTRKSCEERKKRSVIGYLVDSLLMPCCGKASDDHGPQSKATAAKKIKTDSSVPNKSTGTSSSPLKSLLGPSRLPEFRHSESKKSLSSDDGSDNEDNISVIGLGEISERARAYLNSAGSSKIGASCVPVGIPGVPENLSSLAPNRTKLPPLEPLFQSRAMANMREALKKAEADDSIGIPSSFQPRLPSSQLKPPSKKQQRFEKKLIRKLTKQDINRERQGIKAKLVKKKMAVKQELEKVQRSKKRVELEEKFQKEWSKVDTISRAEKRDSTIQRNNAMIDMLEREVELLKEKQEHKLLEYDLLCKKGYNGVVSETVWQCKSMKIRRRYSALGHEISDLLRKVSSLKEEVSKLDPEAGSSSSSTVESKVQDSVEQNSIEQDPFVKSGVASHVCSDRKPEDNSLLALFVGDSFRNQAQTARQIDEKQCLSRFQESCEKSSQTVAVNSHEDDEDNSSIESESTYSFNFEADDEAEDEDCFDIQEPAATPEPPLYRSTRLVPLHKLLPKVLEVINEETDEDLEDYANDVYKCQCQFKPSCREDNDCFFQQYTQF